MGATTGAVGLVIVLGAVILSVCLAISPLMIWFHTKQLNHKMADLIRAIYNTKEA